MRTGGFHYLKVIKITSNGFKKIAFLAFERTNQPEDLSACEATGANPATTP